MASIDKARALYLARTRATKKKEGDEETGGTPSVSLSSVMGGETGGSSHLEVASVHRVLKRTIEKEGEDKAKKKSKVVELPLVREIEELFEHREDEIPEVIVRMRGIPTEIGVIFHQARGWLLGVPPLRPLGL